MEGSAMGIPLIVTDLQGVSMAVKDGQSGFVVPVGDAARLADAITKMADAADLDAFGRSSRALAEETFDERRVFKRVEQEYEQLWDSRSQMLTPTSRGVGVTMRGGGTRP
jgi:glycosyltransferase involved in cell wall biosynthesis